MEFIKRYFGSKTVVYYIGLFFALLSIVSAIVYGASLSAIEEQSAVPIVLLVIAGVAFIALSLFGLDKYGAAAMGILDFAALITYVATIYTYPLTQTMTATSLMDIPYIGSIIACAVLMVVSAIGANVVAWLRMTKKQTPAAQGGAD